MITLEALHYLVSPAGARLLAELADENLDDAHTLRLIMQLRRRAPAAAAGAALELARLRRKAVDKFGTAAADMFFTREALEQASDPAVRAYRAVGSGGLQVVDACCGIGADGLAFAAAGAAVTGIDHDPVRVEMARLNAAALGLDAHFVVGDVREMLPPADLIFFDPARRGEEGRRIHDVEHYQPPLSTVRRWAAPRIGVKLSPAVDLSQVAAYHGAVEFISVEGDLKEAYLRMTPDGTQPPLAEATVIVGGRAQRWAAQKYTEAVIAPPRTWLIEPDAALIRAGRVRDAAVRWNAAQLDESIAYLTGDSLPPAMWARAWRVLDWMPFHVKRLRAYLRERGVGRVTVKKRGTAVSPEVLISQLKLTGSAARGLVLTRYRGMQIVLICEEEPVKAETFTPEGNE